MQAYSNPKRASDPYALPDVEVFYVKAREFFHESTVWNEMMLEYVADGSADSHSAAASALAGWYWWSCLPGCLPDSDPVGPFATEAEALADEETWGNDWADRYPSAGDVHRARYGEDGAE